MKKTVLFAIAALIVLAAAFFPYTTTDVICGNGEVFSEQGEKREEGFLSVEIQETRSWFLIYKKQFSYEFNGEKSGTFATSSYAETDDGYCLISQMYYDAALDQLRACSLFYAENLSYGEIRLDTHKIVWQAPG